MDTLHRDPDVGRNLTPTRTLQTYPGPVHSLLQDSKGHYGRRRDSALVVREVTAPDLLCLTTRLDKGSLKRRVVRVPPIRRGLLV